VRRCYYIIAYDIRCPRRGAKVRRFVQSSAMALQYSVYIGEFTATQRDRFYDDLCELLDIEDRLFMTNVVASNCFVYGNSPLPAGLHLDVFDTFWYSMNGSSTQQLVH